MLIKVGSTLLVPRSATVENDVTSHVADNGQVTLTPEIVTRRTTVKARKGESVATIARRYGLSASSVATWNNVSSSAAFKRGHQVVVFLPLKSRASSSGRRTVKAVKRSTRRAIVKSKRRR
ncbi:MAG: LysM peptidoglycan-binding domain-containing protein, partial [Polaromonas sp.]|nr:LysM peptidoglycan-binding domain-containing protein [Polaromonas sp.]